MAKAGEKPASKTELEQVLIIKSEDPVAVVRRIAGLSVVAEYALIPRHSQSMRDVYFDTTDRAFKRKRMNLRIRKLDGSYWITLKQNPRRTLWGGSARQELEVPWSHQSLLTITNELKRKGIRLEVPPAPTTGEPITVMKRLGLQQLQDRETQREVKDIVAAGEERSPIAELAIDSVTYHFDTQDICLHELEIEVKTKRGRNALRSITRDLITLYGPELREWRHGKLVSGKAIEKLLKENRLQGLLNGCFLKPQAYDLIERVLRFS